MVVPEKILMKKIKKREKVKKQLAASKQVDKTTDEIAVKETERKYNHNDFGCFGAMLLICCHPFLLKQIFPVNLYESTRIMMTVRSVKLNQKLDQVKKQKRVSDIFAKG